MKKRKVLPTLLLSAAALLCGCVMRPAGTAVPSAEPERLVEIEAAPEIVYHSVEFRQGDLTLSIQSVEDGELPQVPSRTDGVRMLGWLDESGQRVDPAAPITADAVYYADTRPLLNGDARWLFPLDNGFLAPEESFTRADALRALDVLLADGTALDDMTAVWRPEEEARLPLTREEFAALLRALFDTASAEETLSEAFPAGDGPVTRARAAYCLSRLLNADPAEDFYFPDAAPDRWAYAELSAAAAPGPLDRETLTEQTLDGFLWFDGYLYRLDPDGYFYADQEIDGLYYGPDGRFTSGSADLDAHVAKTIAGLTEPGQTRRERLRAVYLHVKNDFQYLVRNYYESGAHGWEIPEALTLYETGKGNCYCYAGVFWSLARGLGYNATAYSGTMGNQNQPHAWTEIALDGEIYICDPEIEMNYWWLAAVNHDNSMYTDNFMMPRRTAGGWNYQAVGRE